MLQHRRSVVRRARAKQPCAEKKGSTCVGKEGPLGSTCVGRLLFQRRPVKRARACQCAVSVLAYRSCTSAISVLAQASARVKVCRQAAAAAWTPSAGVFNCFSCPYLFMVLSGLDPNRRVSVSLLAPRLPQALFLSPASRRLPRALFSPPGSRKPRPRRPPFSPASLCPPPDRPGRTGPGQVWLYCRASRGGGGYPEAVAGDELLGLEGYLRQQLPPTGAPPQT